MIFWWQCIKILQNWGALSWSCVCVWFPSKHIIEVWPEHLLENLKGKCKLLNKHSQCSNEYECAVAPGSSQVWWLTSDSHGSSLCPILAIFASERNLSSSSLKVGGHLCEFIGEWSVKPRQLKFKHLFSFLFWFKFFPTSYGRAWPVCRFSVLCNQSRSTNNKRRAEKANLINFIKCPTTL